MAGDRGASCRVIHLVKLAVGVRDFGHLAEIQHRRALTEPPLRHRTRSFPRRAAELAESGSIYWVIGGAVLARQRVLEVIEDQWDDATPCAGLVLDPELVRVAARPMRPFQGWRYMPAADAPPDLEGEADAEGLPDAMRRDLRALALLP